MLIKNWKQTAIGFLSIYTTLTTAVDLVPSIDESIILLGDFNAISLYDNSTVSNNSSTYDLYALSSSNSTYSLVNSDISSLLGSSIPSLWQLIDNSTSIMIIDQEPYVFNLKNYSIDPLSGWDKGHINGEINSIYYDTDQKILYFGGSLSFNETYGALTYDYESEQFFSLPFGGFNENSTINSIIKLDDSDSIIFGGDFYSVGYTDLLNVTYNVTITNNTIVRNTTDIVDISQKIPLDTSSVSATLGDNYANIVCPANDNDGWTLPEGQLGSWSASLLSATIPSKIRLYNSQSDSDGVKYFRILTSPSNGIMNLSYVDPADLTIKFCDSMCPLYLPSNIESALRGLNVTDNEYYTFTNNNQTILQLNAEFQDFAFVNSIEVDSFTVEILEFYDSYAELLGIELFNSGITVYANQSMNENQSCSDSHEYDISVNSETLGGADWLQSSYGDYLYSNVSAANMVNGTNGMRYNINLPVSGDYKVLMYTPGCLADHSCAFRGIVNVSVFDGDGSLLNSQSIYQTNEDEKYDVIYSGSLVLESANSPIYIEMTFLDALYSDYLYVVAQKVELDYLQLDLEEVSGNVTAEVNTTSSGMIYLNGLFEYDPYNFTDAAITYPIGNTSINLIGSALTENATISQLLYNETSLIISGDFDSTYGDNILTVDILSKENSTDQVATDNLRSILGGIANGEVLQLYGPTDDLIIVGSFDSFKNDTSISSGSILYNSFNSSVETLNITNPSEVSALSGFVYNSTEYLLVTYDNTSHENPLIYDFTSGRVFANSTIFAMDIISTLDTVHKDWDQDSNLPESYVIGSILGFDLASSGIASVESQKLSSFVINSNTSLITGVYVDDSKVVVSGSNIYLISNTSSSLLSSALSIDSGSEVNSIMYYADSIIFAVNNTSNFNGTTINGLASLSLDGTSFKTLNETFKGNISALTVDPGFGTIIGVGDFLAGDCQSICTFGNNSEHYYVNRSVSGVSGYVSSVNYYNEYSVLIGGNFTVGQERSYLARYDTHNNSVTSLSMSDALPGPVEKFVFGNETQNDKSLDDVIVIMGSSYVGYFNDSKWTSLGDGLVFSDSQLMDISLVASNSANFYDNQILLLTGKLRIEGYDTMVSSAIWTGEMWVPYTLTATDLDIEDSDIQSVVRMKSMFIYQGTFTSTPSTGTGTAGPQDKLAFTKGQVTGIGFALALATLLLFSLLGLAISMLSGANKEELKGLKLGGEDKVFN